MKLLRRFLPVFWVIIAFPVQAQITFNDSDPGIITIDNGTTYILGLSKTTGGLAYIVSKTTGDTICHGSRDNKLWQVSFNYRTHRDLPEDDFTANLSFAYTWSAAANTLTMAYTPDGGAANKLTATALISVSPESWFDMQLTVQNEYADVIKSIWFPYHLLFEMNDQSEVIYPWSYPGQQLHGEVFTDKQELVDYYPGLFLADYVAMKPQNSIMAIYTHRDGLPIQWTNLGFTPFINNQYQLLEGDQYFFVHQYYAWNPNGSTWTSPVTRIRIDDSYFESLRACRTENRLDNFQTVKQKLGDRYELITQRPMYYIFFGDVNPTTFNMVSNFIQANPGPATIMLNGQFKGGFDHGIYPDVDPDPKWGTAAEYKNMIRKMHDAGHLVMPFTLFMGLHEESTTYANLMEKTTIDQIAIIDTAGEVTFSKFNEEGQYIVSPSNPLLFTEWNRLIDQLFNDQKVDMVYQDVVGVGGSRYDFNPNLSTPVGSKDGWLAETRLFENYFQVVEGGNDRMLETCEGFMGSSIQSIGDDTTSFLEKGWADHFPATTTLFHGQVIPYNFWGNNIKYTQRLSWDISYGMMLDAVLEGGNAEGDDWHTKDWNVVVFDFQREVMPRLLSNELTGYRILDDQVDEFTYQDITVVFNRNKTDAYSVGEFTIVPQGCMVTSDAGDLTAGVFYRFNGENLPEGEHFIITRELSDTLLVIQSKGVDTVLKLALPNSWSSSDTYWAAAYDINHKLIGSQAVSLSGEYLSFFYSEKLEGQHVAFYKIFAAGVKPEGTWSYFFNDFWRERILLGTRRYEISLNRPSCNINYILDKSTGDTLALKSNPIWRAEFPHGQGENDVDANRIDHDENYLDFAYDWSDETRQLTWHYKPVVDTIKRVSGNMIVDISHDDYFDIQLTLENHHRAVMERIRFPYGLDLNTKSTDYIYLPYNYPGVRISGSYFHGEHYFEPSYPIDLVADFVGVDVGNSHFAMYTINKDLPITPVTMFFDRPGFSITENTFNHDYAVYVPDGETWASPTFRIRFGTNVQETLNHYCEDNGINEMPALTEKLGDKYESQLKAPLIYSTFGISFPNFNEAAAITENFPKPSLVLLDWYYPGNEGFHGLHPDIYPPKSDLGTEQEFITMIGDIQGQGHRVAPWTVPAWWNAQSPTIQNIIGSQGIEDIAVINGDGSVAEVWYGPKGYLVSPYHPTVINKMDEWYQHHQETYHFDQVFERWNVGYRIDLDINESESNPANYYQGWYDHQRNHSDAGLLTQTGFDRQLQYALGFVGTMYRHPQQNPFLNLDPELYDPWPVSTSIVRNHLLVYQSGEQQTITKEMLAFNLAYGCMLTLWPNVIGESGYDSSWWDVVKDFQQEVISKFADQRLNGFEMIDSDVTMSRFGDHVVIHNGNPINGYNYGNHTIAAGGAMANISWGAITAGIFTKYNDQSLTGGDHYLIEKQEETRITLWHPMGDDTPVTILKPWSWTDESAITVTAITGAGTESVAVVLNGRKVTFNLNQTLNERKVIRYEIQYGGVLSGKEEEILHTSGIQIRIYPNPFVDQTTIEYQVGQSSRVVIKLVNLYGQEVKMITNETLPAGTYRAKIEANYPSEGIYLLIVEAGGERMIRKLIQLNQ